MKLDILFIHPPSIYDFRKRPLFPGPIACTVSHYTPIFIAVPMGMVSMAEYLERSGCRVRILNLAEWMITNKEGDVEDLLRKIEAKVYGVDLHWCVSSQGSIEVARLCKRLHPDATVILGGLTATCFHDEIVREFPFIDALVRGEGEEVLLELVEAAGSRRLLEKLPSITYRDSQGRVRVNPPMKVIESLDRYDFTRLDLIEPRDLLITASSGLKSWLIPLARGCSYRCRHCGGSDYSYQLLFGRRRPALRSPDRVVEDLVRLREQGIEAVFLIQDPRIGGRRYWRALFEALRRERVDLKQLGVELFVPAGEDFLEAAASTRLPLMMNISPESGNEAVRRRQGRPYSNQQLLDTVTKCRDREIRIAVFFMIGCGWESRETLNDTWALCARLFRMDRELRRGETEKAYPQPLWFRPMIGAMVLLDPGSLAFSNPEEHGYQLHFKRFRDYYEAFAHPSWHQWYSYQTKHFTPRDLANLTLYATEYLIDLEERNGLYSDPEDLRRLKFERFRCKINYFIIDAVERIMKLESPSERQDRLETLNAVVDEYLSLYSWSTEIPAGQGDPYGYWQALNNVMRQSIGVLPLTG
jgi:B12-binding domain/radical SAM domain protein